MSKDMQEATKKLQEECSELTVAADKKNEELKDHEVEIERLKNDLAQRENDLLLALAEALKDRDDLRKKLAETEKNAVKARALPPTPSAPPGPTQRDVDELKQALAEALKGQEDLKKKLAETQVTKTKVQAQKSPTPPSSFSGPAADDVKTSKENSKSQKLLSMAALPPPAQLTMILDLDFASTGAEGTTTKLRIAT
jgi:DNA repair exonuclease SbcCD ATPase subunit